MELKQGFHEITGKEMGTVDALSYSGAKEMLRSAAHYRAYKDKERKPSTDEMIFGSAMHWFVFQPEKFERMVFEDNGKNHNSNDWKAWRDSLPEGAIILPKGDGTPKKPGYEKAKKMRGALEKKKSVMEWLGREGAAERMGLFQDQVYNFWWKIRPDFLTSGVVVEYKTDQSAAISAYVSKLARLEYHLQGGLYALGTSIITGYHHKHFKWIVQEKEEPFESRVFSASPLMLDEARVTLGRIAEKYQRCLDTNEWPGYPDEDYELDLPGWKVKGGA